MGTKGTAYKWQFKARFRRNALLEAERYQDLLDLLELAPNQMWHYRQFGVAALAAMGKKAEAIRYAEEGRGPNDSPLAVARACEEVLLTCGFADEAYHRYGLQANRAGTYLAWFRAVRKKYPHMTPERILADLVKETPGEEGKWFAAAKDVKLFDEAIALANRTPCSPQTLTRAARDFAEKNPGFAVEAGMAALHWLVEGYGYEITSLDVVDAYRHTMKAAENEGRADEVDRRIRDLVAGGSSDGRFVKKILDRKLRLS
ncbi:MAG: hypothetical protein ACC742_12995 [Thermoanaerobaculales bacterium]